MTRHRKNIEFSGNVVYVLGLDYQVKSAVSWQDAVSGIVTRKMTPFVSHPTKRIRSAGGVDMAWPVIVRLNYWVNVPHKPAPELNTRANRHQILSRDGWTCAYCGEWADTVDHVKPESHARRDGDDHNGWTWGNLVAACKACNGRKDDRTPEQAGMKLLWTPHVRGVGQYGAVQARVNEILESGEGYTLESPPL